ncbi:hypothetical protein CTZ27_34605 [Streptomyces griseocarneus]|nr:hypothetical protein CTZ27_34605 [Streptomyces griseocarneus]
MTTLQAPSRTARRALTGPVRLRAQALAMLAALAALCVAAVVGAVVVRGDAARLRDTARDRAATAAELRFALADLDAQRVDSLVPGHSADRPATLPPGRSAEEYEVGNRLLALLTAQQRRTQVSDLLRRLGADAAEGARIRGLLDGLGRYDDLSGRSAQEDEQTPDRAAGHPPAATVMLSAEAGQVMHTELLPGATALAAAYGRQAASAEARAHDDAVRAAIAVGGAGTAAVAVLCHCQFRLAARYRRVLNPPLAAATLAVVVISALGSLSFLSAADRVTGAGRDALRPWTRLAEARAVAAEAAAAQGRWFVEPAPSTVDSARFAALTRRLDGLLAAKDGRASDDVLTLYGSFLADDVRLRQLRAAGRLDEATTVLTEIGRGRVAFDFWDFSTTLSADAGERMAAFAAETGRTRSDLSGWPAVPAGVLAVSAALVLAGLRPRMAEYH